MNTFQEKQKFTLTWIYWLLSGVAGIFLYVMIKLLFFRPVGVETQPTGILILFSVIMLIIVGTILFFNMLQLETWIDMECIKINFKPLTTRKIYWGDIQNAEVIQYQFVGFGVRTSSKYQWIYNVKGNMGLVLSLKNGKKILLGTQKEDELRQFIKSNFLILK